MPYFYKALICVCWFLIFSAPAKSQIAWDANVLPDRALAQKFSLLLQGIPATATEVKSFGELRAQSTDLDTYLRGLIDLSERLFMKERFERVMADYHAYMWRIPMGASAKHAGWVVSKNKSYNEIFSRDYLYIDASMAPLFKDYLAKIKGSFPEQLGVYKKVPLQAEEDRFRGLFASPEFLQIFPDTTSNVNRKRSAQVFRIAFCDTLSNNLEQEPNQEPHLPPSDGVHGHDPDCYGCHRRLDPMARLFDRWYLPVFDGGFASFVPTRTQAGVVYLGGVSGMKKAIPATSDADLGRVVVRQDEFVSCAAKNAWNFVHGSPVKKDPKTLEEVAVAFDSSRSFKGALKQALMHPYFWSNLQPPVSNYSDVKPIFMANCQSCHAKKRGTKFDSERFPFLDDAEENRDLLKYIWSAISRRNGVRPMPELPRPPLDTQYMEQIKNWIQQGARDEQGAVSLDEEQIKEVLE